MASQANSASDVRPADRSARRSRIQRARIALSGTAAGFIGLAPHILHHAGSLAGAAIFGGVAGSLLLGALGLLAAIPLLLRMRRRSGDWRRPAGHAPVVRRRLLGVHLRTGSGAHRRG